ncbi:TIGR03767 family metallophosphoesterase [Streptomyces sp. ODS28]|uniref:TIGR03767 family metallophosphoesterase n=1 Tax=Streptomyces sp. ODS28 TaxID=3136688 RepID=UPI0031F1A4CC
MFRSSSPHGPAGSHSPHDDRTPDRRTVLATAALGAAAGLGAGLGLSGDTAAAGPTGRPRTATASHVLSGRAPVRAPSAEGTTLDSVALPGQAGPGGYRRLTASPGWKRLVRTKLADPKSSEDKRAEKRTPLASFVQLTDLHLVDVQHPLRYEYLRTETPSAWRPHETLSVAGAVALIERVNRLKGGPATGAPLSFVITTGDNTDNNCTAELEWFLTVMSGGRITPNTGDPKGYEGVQNSDSKLYWHPDSALRDRDKQAGYPRVKGLLEAALREVNSPGLGLPWYSTVGNHDALPGGCFATGDDFFTDFALGGRKMIELDDSSDAKKLWATIEDGSDPSGENFRELLKSRRGTMRRVTPDEKRRPFTRTEYVRKHLDPRWAGAGPVGHGYGQQHLDGGKLYYSFEVSEDVAGISLDTTRKDGNFKGRVGTEQLGWLERELKRHRKDGKYVIVFSHHTSTTTPEGGDEVVALLNKHPHAVAWINGHTHKNTIRAQDTFWEVSTASHIDFPQLARVVELTDNQDGTLSLFTTLIESAAPAETDYTDLSQTGLASLYRELGFNDPGKRPGLMGDANDRNTELLLRKP